MVEYIEREAALTVFQNVCAVCMALVDKSMCGECSVADTVRKVKSVPAADVQPVKWIPVTERLPNGNGGYLVSGKDKVWVCEFMILGDVGGWCNSAMNPCVKYWMPLPEPPKDGER
jgi:hypothetical protein